MFSKFAPNYQQIFDETPVKGIPDYSRAKHVQSAELMKKSEVSLKKPENYPTTVDYGQRRSSLDYKMKNKSELVNDTAATRKRLYKRELYDRMKRRRCCVVIFSILIIVFGLLFIILVTFIGLALNGKGPFALAASAIKNG
ncbi:hypothetical protein SNEBB_003877 [Seison nebaliae]|nr:hypothetical protein SNEBB_003877 [Seison nebaliae]